MVYFCSAPLAGFYAAVDNPSHGRRAARYAQSLRGVWFDLSDAEMDLLTEALKHHSDGYTRADITVQLCWDADRLELGPCGH